VSALSAQDTTEVKKNFEKQEKLQVKVKQDANPDVYIDGEKYNSKILNLIDPKKIESINVLKGEQAIEKYNAPNGVILITTKLNAKADTTSEKKVTIRGYGSTVKKDPMVIIDGNTSTHDALSKLNPDKIKSITVLKEQAAIETYNAPEGVIIVETKKRKK